MTAVFDLDARLLPHVQRFPQEFCTAWHAAASFAEEASRRDFDEVLVCGMGGSACAGDLVRGLSHSLGSRPRITLCQTYELPPWSADRTLVLGVSFSGNTEETNGALREAHSHQMPIGVVSSGGTLLQFAHDTGAPAFAVNYDAPPRHALAWMLAPVFRLCTALGRWETNTARIESVTAWLDAQIPSLHERAAEVADSIHDRVVSVVAADHLAPVARRWKNQLNENAKQIAFADEIPEGNHNSIMGIEFPSRAALHTVFLRGTYRNDRIRKRVELVSDIMHTGCNVATIVDIPGETALEQALAGIVLGDLVSLHVARCNQVDPMDIGRITTLKRLLG